MYLFLIGLLFSVAVQAQDVLQMSMDDELTLNLCSGDTMDLNFAPYLKTFSSSSFNRMTIESGLYFEPALLNEQTSLRVKFQSPLGDKSIYKTNLMLTDNKKVVAFIKVIGHDCSDKKEEYPKQLTIEAPTYKKPIKTKERANALQLDYSIQ